MRKYLVWVLVFFVLVFVVWFLYPKREVSTIEPEIIVESPKKGDKISSPQALKGSAPGSWYFEASAPVEVLDENGKLLGQSYVTAQGEWMTEDFVQFTGSITFTKSQTKKGVVVFRNDNPSGDPSRSKSFTVPVSFE